MAIGETTDNAPQAHVEVIITQIDMPLFKAFIAHKRAFEILLQAGIFEQIHGKATINFHEGHIQSVTAEQRMYQHIAPPRS